MYKQARVLIVEDQTAPREELRFAFQVIEKEQRVSLEVVEAASVEQFHSIVREQPIFDVLVADLKLRRGDTLDVGVDEVVSWQMVLNPLSVVIIHSAFTPDIDPTDRNFDPIAEVVRITTRAMRAGASDCILKARHSSRRVAEVALDGLRRGGGSKEFIDAEFWNSPNGLSQLKNYEGKAIAVEGQSILLAADSISALRQKLKERAFSWALPKIIVVPDFIEDPKG